MQLNLLKLISLQRYTDCVIFDPENQQIILTSNDLMSDHDQDTLEFQHEFPLEKYDFLFDLKFQPCTHNLLLYDSNHQIHVLSDAKTTLATIKIFENIERDS